MFFSESSTWRFSPTVPVFPFCSLSSNRCCPTGTDGDAGATDEGQLDPRVMLAKNIENYNDTLACAPFLSAYLDSI